jgi:hypothetical protein
MSPYLAGCEVPHHKAQVTCLLLLEPRHLPPHPLNNQVTLLLGNVRLSLPLQEGKRWMHTAFASRIGTSAFLMSSLGFYRFLKLTSPEKTCGM